METVKKVWPPPWKFIAPICITAIVVVTLLVLYSSSKYSGQEPIKPCPGNELFCEEIDDYPYEAALLGPEITEADLVKQKLFLSSTVGARSGFVQESRACDHRKSTVYPKKARNVDGAFVFIKNDEQYKQAVDIEQCLGEGGPCRTEGDISFGETVCRQKYTTYKMYVINEAGDQVYDSFSLPSACLCFHKSNFAIRGGAVALSDGSGPQFPSCPSGEKLLLPRKTEEKTNIPVFPGRKTEDQTNNPVFPGRKTEDQTNNPVFPGTKEKSSLAVFPDSKKESDLPVFPESPEGQSLVPQFPAEDQQPTLPVFPSSESQSFAPVFPEEDDEDQKDLLPVFPTKTTERSTAVQFSGRKRRQTNPPACTGTVCETSPSYPDNDIRAALQLSELGNDQLFQQLFDSQCQDQLVKRGFNIDEEQLCYGLPKIIFPKVAKNLREEWKYVVNIDNYTQSVEIEECDNSTRHANTGDFGDLLKSQEEDDNNFGVCLYSGSEGNNPDLTVCRQLYTEHKLLALSDENQLVVDTFELPSACACFIREDFLLEFRKGEMDEEEEGTLPPQVEEGPGDRVTFGQGR